MSDSSGFRRTGTVRPTSTQVHPVAAPQVPFSMMDPRDQLVTLLKERSADKPFSELFELTFDHRAVSALGHVLLDTLEVQGFSVDDIDAVGALTTAAIPLVDAMIHAASSRGEELDGFVMDFVYPSVKGPSILNKRVVLVDAWLSEKSFIQTSSLVTLHEGNALDLDCSVIAHEHAQVVAIASLIGGVSKPTNHIHITDTVSGDEQDIPFIYVVDEASLRDSRS